MSILGNRIKQLRNEKHITQTELGKIVGVVKSTMSMYESGKSTPNDDIKKNLADYFDVSIDYLLGMTDIRKQYNNSLKPNDKKGNEKNKDIEKDIESLKKKLETQDGLMLSGEPATSEAIQSIIDAMKIGMEIAKQRNKKYASQKSRK